MAHAESPECTPGFLDVLHHAADDDVAGRVAQRVDVDLDGVFEEPVDEHRPLGREPAFTSERPFGGHRRHRVVEAVDVEHDLHGAPAEHVRRPDQHGEAEALGHLARGLGRARDAAGRLRDPEVFAQALEALAVFGEVDRVGAGAEDGNARRFERARQLQRRLPTEGDDHARQPAVLGRALLQAAAHREDVFGRERLEEEAIAGVVVGGHRLGIAVEHDGLEARVGQCERGVHAAVVELDALPDAVGPAAEDHHRGPVDRLDLVFVLVGAVVIRRARGELRRAGVDRLVGDVDARGPARREHRRLVDAPEVRELRVGEPEPLDPSPVGPAEVVDAARLEPRARLAELEDVVEEPRVDPGRVVQPLDRHARAAARLRAGTAARVWASPPAARARRRCARRTRAPPGRR